MGLYVERGLSVENLYTGKYDIFQSLVAEMHLYSIDKNLCPWNYKHKFFRKESVVCETTNHLSLAKS